MTSWLRAVHDAIGAFAAFREAAVTFACLFEECIVPCPISEWPVGAVIDWSIHYVIPDARVTYLAFLAACVLCLLIFLLAPFVR